MALHHLSNDTTDASQHQIACFTASAAALAQHQASNLVFALHMVMPVLHHHRNNLLYCLAIAVNIKQTYKWAPQECTTACKCPSICSPQTPGRLPFCTELPPASDWETHTPAQQKCAHSAVYCGLGSSTAVPLLHSCGSYMLSASVAAAAAMLRVDSWLPSEAASAGRRKPAAASK